MTQVTGRSSGPLAQRAGRALGRLCERDELGPRDFAGREVHAALQTHAVARDARRTVDETHARRG